VRRGITQCGKASSRRQVTSRPRHESAARLVTAVSLPPSPLLFQPYYLPLLLQSPPSPSLSSGPVSPPFLASPFPQLPLLTRYPILFCSFRWLTTHRPDATDTRLQSSCAPNWTLHWPSRPVMLPHYFRYKVTSAQKWILLYSGLRVCLLYYCDLM